MTVRFQQVLWLSFWLAGACATPELHAALTPEKLYQKVLPSVMTLEVESQSGEKFIGSAVLALADDVALTAWHVVADARSIFAVFADGQRVKVTGCVDFDGGRDQALLKLEKRLPKRQATLARGTPAVASRAYVVGTPKGCDFSITDGLISQIRSVHGLPQYQLSCPISPGNSGSPVFNRDGEIIGIASWTKADAQNVSFAIPIHEYSRLNLSRHPATWEQLAAAAHPAPPASLQEPRQRNDQVLEAKPAADSFDAFVERLNDSVGKSLTVIVQDAGQTNIFKFTVK